MRLDARSLAPLLLVTLVALMVILAAVLLVESAPQILPDATAAVEWVSGSY
jgi:hypothetical protein